MRSFNSRAPNHPTASPASPAPACHCSPHSPCGDLTEVHPKVTTYRVFWFWVIRGRTEQSCATRNPWNILPWGSGRITGMHKEKCCAQRVQGSLNSFFVYKSFYSLGFKREKNPLYSVLWRVYIISSHIPIIQHKQLFCHHGQEAITAFQRKCSILSLLIN